MKVEEGVELSRFTTLGAGGPAKAFARPESVEELEEALAWAREHELPVATVGLGSNLLVADEGFDGLVLKLGGELAEASVEGEQLLAGGGAHHAGDAEVARLAARPHRHARGIEVGRVPAHDVADPLGEARRLAPHDLDWELARKGERRAVGRHRHARPQVRIYTDTDSRRPARMTFCLNS